MGKTVKSYKVEHFNKVDTSKYVEGDIFLSKKTVGILVDGKIKTFGNGSPNLRNYVKKEDVQKMIDESLKKGGEDGE